jgi:hypothetical protein
MAKKINFRLPNRFELGMFILAFILFGILDYAQNLFQDTENINAVTRFGISAINLFWVSVILYHIVLFTAIFRAYNAKSTHYVYDFIFGTLAIVGVYGIVGGAIGGIYYQTNEAIPWFFGLTQITIYHIFGVGLQVMAFIWFASTE